MKALIIEDEKLVGEQLARLVTEADKDIEVIAITGSVKTSVKWLSENPLPDLIFMDIQLSDGISFEIFEKISIECSVIFTTAYQEYAIRAFKVNSVDYLVKPVDKDDLKKALEKFKKMYHQPLFPDLKEIIGSLSKPSSPVKYKMRFLVQFRNNFIPVESNQIAYIYKDQLIYLVTYTNEKYILDYNSLEEVEELVDPAYFFRANRQNIIQLGSVENFKSDYSGKLLVKLISPFNIHVDVSREKSKAFKMWLEK
jgi:DNA-binding LytR/AlgR family response regulator